VLLGVRAAGEATLLSVGVELVSTAQPHEGQKRLLAGTSLEQLGQVIAR